jgi:hypothetical protein
MQLSSPPGCWQNMDLGQNPALVNIEKPEIAGIFLDLHHTDHFLDYISYIIIDYNGFSSWLWVNN